MKRIALGLFIALCVASVPQHAFAHVLVMDTSGKQGAIVHIVPDDDPIAGDEATIYFDRQSADGKGSGVVTLTIRGEAGDVVNVPVETKDALTLARYTFPKQGVYELVFTVQEKAGEVRFTQSQRVTRGITNGTSVSKSYLWAEGLLVASGAGLLVLGIFFFNRRQEIKNYSKF